MEYSYILILLISILVSTLVLLRILKILSSKRTLSSKSNLSKRFLTFCYNRILSSKITTDIESYQEIMTNFLNLVQKLFESKFVVHFKVHQNTFTLQNSTEPFFPFLSSISKLKKIFSETNLTDLLPEIYIKALYIEKNKHRIAIPNDISIFTSKELKDTFRELNINTVILVPIYKDTIISNLFLIFTNKIYISEESLAILNTIIDFLSVSILLIANRKLTEELLKTTSESNQTRESVTTCELTIDLKTNDIETNCNIVTMSELKSFLNLEEIVKETKKTGSLKTMKNIEIENGYQILFDISAEYLADNKIKIKVSKFKYKLEKTEDTLVKIADLMEIPIVIISKQDQKIISSNKKFKALFPESNKYEDLQSLKSSLKYIGEEIIVQNEMTFHLKKISTETTQIEGIIFYPIQIADQRTVIHLYNEALRIRKLMNSMNLYESKSNSANLEIYVKYQLSEQIIQIGGDFFVAKDNGKKTIIGVFDVAGHSLSAGFLALMAKNIIEKGIQQQKTIEKIIEELNESIFSINDKTLDPDTFSYITGIICEVDVEKMKAKIISTGHRYGLILKEDSIIQILNTVPIHKPIGIKSNEKFEPYEIQISPTDKFFLYTDGIVELETPKGNQIDEFKIIDLIVFCKNLSIKDTIEEIFSYIKGLKEVKVKDDFVILGFKAKS
ncbi:MAG: PP2C family protein-serine/threonine phosphatase [Brevinematia bacterium]